MSPTESPIGRREASKRARREAIERAARELFAAQGFEATTVRQIADAAGVTERTFYRYFDGKEGLIAADAGAWMDRLHAAIRARPADEPPLESVRRAAAQLARQIAASPEATPIWLFTGQPRPFELLARSAPRPLLRFEDAVATGLWARGATPGEEPGGGAGPPFPVALVARVAVALLRSIAIRRRELEHAGTPADPVALLDEAFGLVSTARR